MQVPMVFKTAIFIAFTAAASGNSLADPGSACGKPGLSSGTYTMMHDGKTRSFRVHVPTNYNKEVKTPLITIFHGWGGNENEFLDNATVTSLADERNYILVAPRGLGSGPPDNSFNSWSFSGSTSGLDGDGANAAVPADTAAICDYDMTEDYSYPSCADQKSNTCSWTQCQANDIDFVLSLIEKVKGDLCVDTDRIFATGGSNGGMFTWELGQNPLSATAFRAIAPLIGLPHRAYLNSKGKPDDLPALLITGTQDTTVPPGAWDDPSFTITSNGSDRYYYTGATAITRSWAKSHGCKHDEPAVAFDDGFENVDCRSFCSADIGWPRVLDCRVEMGHSYEFDWSWELILNFFDAHSVDQNDNPQ